MSFKIDKQTLEELNLLGKFRQGSVYHLFNKVKTRGGEKLLDDMFHHPLLEPTAINKRSAVFRFFREQKLLFPFDVMQINLMREYLDGGAKKNAPMVLVDVFLKKMLSSLTRDERFKKDSAGITGNDCDAEEMCRIS